MPSTFIEELGMIRSLICDSEVHLESFIGDLIARTPKWKSFGDSCKGSGGGWCTDLSFWWYLAYPDDIVTRAHLASAKEKGYICINCLEMVVVIVNFAAVIYVCHVNGIDISLHPVLLNWCDNTSAVSWVNKRCKSSLIGRALGRLFMGLLLSTNISINSEWLSTVDNKIADEVSRFKKDQNVEYNFSRLVCDYPQLQQCRQFQPSAYLLDKIYSTLRGQCLPDPMELKNLSPSKIGSFIG